jgi:hypothetical protein
VVGSVVVGTVVVGFVVVGCEVVPSTTVVLSVSISKSGTDGNPIELSVEKAAIIKLIINLI